MGHHYQPQQQRKSTPAPSTSTTTIRTSRNDCPRQQPHDENNKHYINITINPSTSSLSSLSRQRSSAPPLIKNSITNNSSNGNGPPGPSGVPSIGNRIRHDHPSGVYSSQDNTMPNNNSNNNNHSTPSSDPVPPTPSQLFLISLDYFRAIRRSHSSDELITLGIDPHHLSISIYALSRTFLPSQTGFSDGNDSWIQEYEYDDGRPPYPPLDITGGRPILLPDIKTLEDEILLDGSSNNGGEGDVPEEYEYDDAHASNVHRFYHLGGLACGGGPGGPISLPEMVGVGLAQLGAKSRREAEMEMVKSPLFHQFVSAVREKGFFKDAEEHENPNAYKDRYRKVVAKFRSKLAAKAEAAVTTLQRGNDGGNVERNVRSPKSQAEEKRENPNVNPNPNYNPNQNPNPNYNPNQNPNPNYNPNQNPNPNYNPNQNPNPNYNPNPIHTINNELTNAQDLDEAERLKTYGNAHMQKKDYPKAVEAYTTALKICPAGPSSHVYFSNRAAALLSMKKYQDAILDSERSLALKPDYGKAHARLGLAHYLLGDYEFAVDAYNLALKYEPENKASRGYLEKAKAKLKSRGGPSLAGHSTADENDKTPSRSNKKSSSSSSSRLLPPSSDDHDQHHQQQTRQQQLVDQRDADKFKSDGNTHMSRKEYQAAVDCYTKALTLSPSGNGSHVYYANRAAALCYLERYAEAEMDSERSLALKPDYGKAHARLGLSRFFLGDYGGAVEAYGEALRYDPNNAASKSYLAKARARLDEMGNTKGGNK